jgi:hypothetical protein
MGEGGTGPTRGCVERGEGPLGDRLEPEDSFDFLMNC